MKLIEAIANIENDVLVTIFRKDALTFFGTKDEIRKKSLKKKVKRFEWYIDHNNEKCMIIYL